MYCYALNHYGSALARLYTSRIWIFNDHLPSGTIAPLFALGDLVLFTLTALALKVGSPIVHYTLDCVIFGLGFFVRSGCCCLVRLLVL